MQINGDFDIVSLTPGIVVVLAPRRGVPSGLSQVTRIEIFTARAGHGGWQVGRPLIVRVQ